jgi:hypothetical protein
LVLLVRLVQHCRELGNMLLISTLPGFIAVFTVLRQAQLFTEDLHQVVHGRSLTFMDRCPYLFMNTVHEGFTRCLSAKCRLVNGSVHGRP